MSVDIFDVVSQVNVVASNIQIDDLTLMSDYWNKDESSEQPTNGDHSQKYPVQTANYSSEEQMLDSVFRVCDSEERGKVSVFQIIDYLKSVTDPSRDGNRLQCLCTMLDPDDQGTLVDLQTFRAVMTKWIASCCQDRGEQTDLMNKLTDLSFTNKKLIEQNTKLLRNLELAEETNAHLTEEISELTCKQKRSQQAMHEARSVRNELEDVKTFTKSLEDKIGVLCTQKKQLEKDTLLLSSQKQSLQEENDKLLIEKEKVKKRLDGLSAENSKLVQQLCEYENLLLQNDELLAQKTIKSEELQGLVEEHKFLLEELKIEKNRLQDQLLQTIDDMAIYTSLSRTECFGILSVQSVCKEIEEIQEWRLTTKFGLPNPLCGISGYINTLDVDMPVVDIWAEAELVLVQLKQEMDKLLTDLHQIASPGQSITYLEEQSSILLQSLSCLVQLKCAWETYASKLNGASQINTDNGLSLSPKERSPTEWSLLPVNNQLVPHRRQMHQHTSLTGGSMSWLCTDEGYLWAQFRTRLISCFTVPRLLLVALLYTFLFFPRWSGEHIWTVLAGLLWPHLKVQHLVLPPI